MNKRILNTLLVSLVVTITLLVSSCSIEYDQNTTNIESSAMEQGQKEAIRQVGMPLIDDYFEKKMAKQIFELRDNAKLITYAYNVNLNGKYVYLGRCIGFGLPYSVQYTNPEKMVNRYGETISRSGNVGYDPYIISQADPNGLYMPEGLSATWLMLINEETGEPEIIYMEPTIVVTQSKLPKRLVEEWSLTEDYDKEYIIK